MTPIGTEAEFAALHGTPNAAGTRKVTTRITDGHRRIMEAAPFRAPAAMGRECRRGLPRSHLMRQRFGWSSTQKKSRRRSGGRVEVEEGKAVSAAGPPLTTCKWQRFWSGSSLFVP